MFDTNALLLSAIGLGYVVLAVVLLIAAKFVADWLTPFKIDRELTGKDNPALGLTVSAYFAGVLIILVGATVGPEWVEIPPTGFILEQMGVDAAYAFGGILVLNLSRVIVDKLILTRFSTRKEIIEDRNAGTAAVEGGCMIATALIVAGAIQGSGTWIDTLIFVGVGLVALIAFARFYQWITPFDVHDEIERDNVAAGVAMGMSYVAIGIILMKAISGDFESWAVNLSWFGVYAVGGMVVLMFLRWVVDLVLLPNATLKEEIARDRNLGVAWIEGTTAVGIAALLFFQL